MRPLVEVGIGWLIVLGLAPQPVLTPSGPCRLSDARDAIGCGLQMLAHLFCPSSALRRRAKEGLRELLDVQTGMLVVHHASPRQWAPRALGGGHRFQHGVVIVTGVVPVVAARDQAETLRVDVWQDVLDQGRQVCGHRGRP